MINMKVLDYRITSDSYQVIVKKAIRNKKGEISTTLDKKTGEKKENTTLIGYYGDLSRALIGIQRNHVFTNDKEIQTIKEYKEELEAITKVLEKSLEIKGE